MNTRHPEALKPHATFVLPSQGMLCALDRAHEQGFRRFLRDIGHNERNPAHRRRASTALVELINGVAGEELPPDYDDPYVAAAYLVKYHLSHCMMAYWAFGLLLDRVDVPSALYLCDIGAGTGAARIGLALALSRRKACPPTIYFNAIEPSGWMRDAGNAFWRLGGRMLISFIGRRMPRRKRGRLPIPNTDDVLRVVSAFHLSLPWDGRWGSVGKDAKSNIQSVLDLVSPHVGVFTCHLGKARSLTWALGDFTHWFDIPSGCGAVSVRSRFYTACAEALGFTVKVPEDSNYPVRTWSRYRFSPPSGVLLLQDKRAGQEARERQRRAAVERQRQEREHRERAEAAERERQRRAEEECQAEAERQEQAARAEAERRQQEREQREQAKAEQQAVARAELQRREPIGVNEAAQRLGLSAAYVSRLLREGKLAGTKGPGKLGRWQVDAAAVDRLAKQRRAESERREKAEQEERKRQQRAAAARRERAERRAALCAGLQRPQQKRKRWGILARLWNALKRN